MNIAPSEQPDFEKLSQEEWIKHVGNQMESDPEKTQQEYAKASKRYTELTWKDFFYQKLIIHPKRRTMDFSEARNVEESDETGKYTENHNEYPLWEKDSIGKNYTTKFGRERKLNSKIKETDTEYRIYITLDDPTSLTLDDLYGKLQEEEDGEEVDILSLYSREKNIPGLKNLLEEKDIDGMFKYSVDGKDAKKRMETIVINTYSQDDAEKASAIARTFFAGRGTFFEAKRKMELQESFFGNEASELAKRMLTKIARPPIEEAGA